MHNGLWVRHPSGLEGCGSSPNSRKNRSVASPHPPSNSHRKFPRHSKWAALTRQIKLHQIGARKKSSSSRKNNLATSPKQISNISACPRQKPTAFPPPPYHYCPLRVHKLSSVQVVCVSQCLVASAFGFFSVSQVGSPLVGKGRNKKSNRKEDRR